MSFIEFSKANLGEERDAGEEPDAALGTLGAVRIFAGKLCIGTVAVKATLCGSLNEESSDKVVEGKGWSISLAVTVDRKVNNAMSAARLSSSDINVGLPEESRNLVP